MELKNMAAETEDYAARDLEKRLAVVASVKASGLRVFDFTGAVGKVITLDLDESPIHGKFNYVDVGFTTSKSGRQHGFVLLPAYLRNTKIIGTWGAKDLACYFGSDPVREQASASNETDGQPHTHLMFETPEGAKVLEAIMEFWPKEIRDLVKELNGPAV